MDLLLSRPQVKTKESKNRKKMPVYWKPGEHGVDRDTNCRDFPKFEKKRVYELEIYYY